MNKLNYLLLAVIPVLTGVASLIRIKTNEPPSREILHAGSLLSEARLAGSPTFAAEDYELARLYFDSALAEWGRQNERLILLRNFSRTAELAEKSARSSKNAVLHSAMQAIKTENGMEQRIGELEKAIADFEDRFERFPLTNNQRKNLANCKLQLSEGSQALSRGNYEACLSTLEEAENTIGELNTLYEARLLSYLEALPEWKQMVEQTITHSRMNRTYAIVVDKMDRELLLYKDGKISAHFPVELGINWLGDKQKQGDKRTPEGQYTITEKKARGHTRYHKALLLDYPNEEDRKRFLLDKTSGLLEPGTKIGSLIEIHGQGGKGMDWTDGCIALSNGDMDQVFGLCPVGTKVTIVGSAEQ